MRASLAAVFAVIALGCGSDPRFAQAQHTVELAERALARVEPTSGGDDVRSAHAEAERWHAQSEDALAAWPGTGSLAFETMVPCLAHSLGALREALARAGRPVPETLRDAEAMARTATERRCARGR